MTEDADGQDLFVPVTHQLATEPAASSAPRRQFGDVQSLRSPQARIVRRSGHPAGAAHTALINAWMLESVAQLLKPGIADAAAT